MNTLDSHPPRDSLPGPIRDLVDLQAERFRLAWQRDETPQLEQYLDGLPREAQQELLPILLTIELEHRRDATGSPVHWQALAELHPRFMDEIKLVYDRVAVTQRDQQPEGESDRSARSHTAADDTVMHTPTGSSGLHIRCPHCSNPVELVADSALDDITCASCGSKFNLVDPDETTASSKPLDTVGRFELITRLGMGGFGAVWKARDTELERTVAVKIPRKGRLSRIEAEQFYREARSAAQLQHPNIVTIHEVGRAEDTIFIVSDLVRGVSLADWLSAESPTNRDTAEICEPIARALHHAHESGIIHRDLKPSNVMLDEASRPHIMDFGLAKREVGEITMTVDGQVLGTPAYMSPEQASGKSHWTDRRTDVYSLGVIMFRMLTGELPFRGNSQMQVHQRLTEDAPDPRNLNRHVSRDMATVCLKCLERDPTKRYPTARAVADELQRVLEGAPIKARPISHAARIVRWAKRKPALAASVFLVLLLAIGGPAAALWIHQQNLALTQLLAERNRLIGRLGEEKEASLAERSRLQQQLDTWEGRANPWQIWPPDPMRRPYELALRQLFDEQYESLRLAFAERKSPAWEYACGQLALAMMADRLNDPLRAVAHYQAAEQQLAAAAAATPTRPELQLALADCATQLARLHASNSPERAREYLARADAAYSRLASGGTSLAAHAQVGQIASALSSATLSGFEAGEEQLRSANELLTRLHDSWPTDPVELYELASLLTDRQPVLVLGRSPVTD